MFGAPDTPLRLLHASVATPVAPRRLARSRRGLNVDLTLLLAAMVLLAVPVGGFLTHRWLRRLPGEPARPVAIAGHFSLRAGCTAAIIAAADQAKREAFVQAYSFASTLIAQILAEACCRGERVEVLLDGGQRSRRHTVADAPVAYDTRAKTSHNKVTVIGGTTAIIGSSDFTQAAEEGNAENPLIIKDATPAMRFAENWRGRLAGAEAYAGR